MDDDYLKADQSWLAYTNRTILWLKERIVNTSIIISLPKKTILTLLNKIQHGQITINTNHQERFIFGTQKQQQEDLTVNIQVQNNAFWLRMFLLSDLGFAEAYMVGDIQVDRLDTLFKIFIHNRENLSDMSMLTSTLFTTLNKLINSRFANTISNTLQNISAHYDISNEMFEAFLSKDMTYSCAYFPPSLGGPDGDLIKSLPSDQQEKEDPIKKRKKQQDVLELAQYAKIDLIIEKAKIRRGDRVLEIGTGWGSFAIRAVSRTGCSVETVTLSQEQKRLAEARITAAGLSDKIRVHLLDYRHLPTHFKGTTFHRIVSIEMIEAVGIEFLNTFFHVIHQCLHPSIGIAVFQVITIPEARFQRYLKQVDFIRKWIFPGGVLPTVTLITSGITEGSRGQLLIDSVQNIGPHYARTLREWEGRFVAQFESQIAPCLRAAYPELVQAPHRIQIFKRKWIYYFQYCAVGFHERVLGDHIFTVTREGNKTL